MTAEQGLSRLLGAIRRRRVVAMVAAAAALAILLVAVLRVRPVYRASAVVRALESQPSAEYVPPTTAEQIGERLRTLRLAVMARPLVEQVVRAEGIAEAMKLDPGEAVESVRARLEVKLEGDDTWLVTFEDSDPVRAKRVLDALLASFVERQVVRRQQVAAATERALASEVARLRPEYQRLEAAVRDFKLAHDGALPEQQEENLRVLDQATLEINILSTNLDAAEERRRQMIAGVGSALRHQEALLEAQLHEVRTRYTPEHPEVRRVLAELQTVRAARMTEEDRHRGGVQRSPELLSLDRDITRQRAQLTALRKRQEVVRTRLAETAKNGQALAAMATELDAVRHKYQAAMSKLTDAQLAVVLEDELRALRFETVEAAARPMHPVKPNRPLLALGALFAAALIGVAAGLLRDLADPTVQSAEALQALTQPIEVLVAVPPLGVTRRVGGRSAPAQGRANRERRT